MRYHIYIIFTQAHLEHETINLINSSDMHITYNWSILGISSRTFQKMKVNMNDRPPGYLVMPTLRPQVYIHAEIIIASFYILSYILTGNFDIPININTKTTNIISNYWRMFPYGNISCGVDI